MDRYVHTIKASLEKLSFLRESNSSVASIYQENDIDYILNDLFNLMADCKEAINRIGDIMLGLRSMSSETTAEGAGDVNASIEMALDVIWSQLKYKCTVKKEFLAVPPVVINSDQLVKIFASLLLNAANRVAQPGIITLATGAEKGFVFVRIHDNGDTLTEDKIKNLFKLVESEKNILQVENLNLKLIYDVIYKAGGRITVESVQLQGTTIIILLPVELKA